MLADGVRVGELGLVDETAVVVFDVGINLVDFTQRLFNRVVETHSAIDVVEV